jgi:hypothetical protein
MLNKTHVFGWIWCYCYKFYRCMTCWSCTMIVMFLMTVCYLKFLQLGKWVICKSRMVVPEKFKTLVLYLVCAHDLFVFYLGNRGCKIAGIRGNTDTFDFRLQVILLNIWKKTRMFILLTGRISCLLCTLLTIQCAHCLKDLVYHFLHRIFSLESSSYIHYF